MKINYPAVLVAGILHWILGAVWYGIFTNKFVELMAWTPQQLSEIESQSHTKEYVLAFLSSLVLVYVLAHFLQYTQASNLVSGLQTAFWLWLGFVATSQLATVIFEGRKPGSISLEYRLSAGRLFGCRSTFGHLETASSHCADL
jgi:magnesium-transporting ATPase (P-type)